MKKLAVIIIFSVLASISSEAQVGKFLKNVKNSVTQDLLGTPDNASQQKSAPEPSCACDPAELVFEVGKYKIDYSELNISVLDDGRVLAEDKMNSSYYVIKGGVTEGPLKENDPRVTNFRAILNPGSSNQSIIARYSEYIKKQGDKYIIVFQGKTYGPYAQIDKFAVTKSKEKFLATVTENIAVTADDGKKMEEAIKNAKTQEEQMELAMKYSQQIQEKMMSGGGPTSILPKYISNVPLATPEQMGMYSATVNASMKYDELLVPQMDKITDLTGKKIVSFTYGQCSGDFFISSDNSRTACYSYGTLTFSDGKKLSELFNPHLVKVDGKIWLAYMYFSPKRNAIMLCRIPF
jgi:hypothetical protein